jgi:hypothetical protein
MYNMQLAQDSAAVNDDLRAPVSYYYYYYYYMLLLVISGNRHDLT